MCALANCSHIQQCVNSIWKTDVISHTFHGFHLTPAFLSARNDYFTLSLARLFAVFSHSIAHILHFLPSFLVLGHQFYHPPHSRNFLFRIPPIPICSRPSLNLGHHHHSSLTPNHRFQYIPCHPLISNIAALLQRHYFIFNNYWRWFFRFFQVDIRFVTILIWGIMNVLSLDKINVH